MKTFSMMILIYAVLALLVTSDIFLVLISSDYRNLLGVIDESDFFGFSYRIAPDVLMLIFYILIILCWARSKTISRKVVLGHGYVYIFLGLALCIPWIGMFVAPLTPIGILYLNSIALFSSGYYFSILLALIFIFINVYMLMVIKKE